MELQAQAAVGAAEGRAGPCGVRPRRLSTEQARRGGPPSCLLGASHPPAARSELAPADGRPRATHHSALPPRAGQPRHGEPNTPPRPKLSPEARPALPAAGGCRGPPRGLLGVVVLGRARVKSLARVQDGRGAAGAAGMCSPQESGMKAVGVRMVTRSRSRGPVAGPRGVGEDAVRLRMGEAAAGSAAPGLGHRRRGR